jgi:hypothetical protein
LDLHQFTDEEFGDVFDKIVQSSPARESEGMSAHQLQTYLLGRIQELEEESEEIVKDTSETEFLRKRFVEAEVGRIWQVLVEGGDKGKSMYKDDFCRVLREMATRVDLVRSLPIVTSMMIVGASVGVITPAMPFVVENLGLSTSQYGVVVSAFAYVDDGLRECVCLNHALTIGSFSSSQPGQNGGEHSIGNCC